MFVLSKLLSAITQPLFWLGLWWAVALLMLERWQGRSVRMLWAGMGVLVLLGFQAFPDALLRPLENRYSVPAEAEIDGHVGIIVLGGMIGHPSLFAAHGQVPLTEAAERLTVPAGLLRKHPKLALVFSGGDARLLQTGVSESELARIFYQEQGLDITRIQFEDGSRNTRENARLVAALLGERCKQPWLLVTSAWHMPRSMQEFEHAGCTVTAYPVDFWTGASTPLTDYSLVNSLLRWQTALHELLGSLVYRLTR